MSKTVSKQKVLNNKREWSNNVLDNAAKVIFLEKIFERPQNI